MTQILTYGWTTCSPKPPKCAQNAISKDLTRMPVFFPLTDKASICQICAEPDYHGDDLIGGH